MDTSTSLLDHLRQCPDETAWKRLDDLYRPLILRWLRRDPSLGEDAEDLAQEILSVVYQELDGFQRERKGSFRKWLRTITAYRLNNHYRKRNALRKKERPDSPDGLLAELADDRTELARRWDQEHNEHVVHQLLDIMAREFTGVEARAFRRQVFDGARPADVAAELQVSLNVVYLAKSRVLARLREIGKGLLD